MNTNELYLTAKRKGVAESLEEVCRAAGMTVSSYTKSLYALRMAGPGGNAWGKGCLFHRPDLRSIGTEQA